MPQIADRKSMARYICVDKGATHPALQREELPKHIHKRPHWQVENAC